MEGKFIYLIGRDQEVFYKFNRYVPFWGVFSKIDAFPSCGIWESADDTLSL